jgi:FkbM family methyltransferase
MFRKVVKTSHPFYGGVYGIKNDRFVFQRIRRGEIYEPHLVEAFRSLLSPETIAVDIGANIGVHSIAMSLLQPKLYRIHAFEPHPEILPILKLNAKQNPIIRVEEYALSDEEKKAEMRFLNGTDNPGGSLVFDMGGSNKPDFVIEQRCLDSYEFDESISLMKIDVEGHEMKVIRGALDTIQAHKPNLIVEIWDLDNLPIREEKIRFITSLGYSVEPLSQIDLLFLPNKV